MIVKVAHCPRHHLRGKQLDAPREAVDVHQGPERVSRADPAEEQHDSRVVDAVEDTTLLVHPESDDVALVGKLLRQRLGPEATLGHQVGAGVLGQRVRVDAGWVLAGEAQPQGPAPTALLLGDLQPDLLVDEDRAVAEGDGVAEAGLPLDSLVAEVHEDLGALGVRVEEQRRGWEPPTRQHRWAVLLLVVASVRSDGEGAPDGVFEVLVVAPRRAARVSSGQRGDTGEVVTHGIRPQGVRRSLVGARPGRSGGAV